MLHPLGRLAVRQQVVPLNTERDVDTYGGAPVAGDRRFTITAAALNGSPQTPAATQDLFVPTQFFDMSDDEKLAAPSFESRDNGVVFGSDAIAFPAGESIDAPLVYETIVIDDAAGEAGAGAAALRAVTRAAGVRGARQRRRVRPGANHRRGALPPARCRAAGAPGRRRAT